MRLFEIIQFLEEQAPLSLQETYDNSGLQIGHKNMEVHQALIALDVTEEVVDEAIARNCQLILVHHPLLFKGLKKLGHGKNYIDRSVVKAIKNDIAIYAAHTNLDNMMTGVNHMIGKKLGVPHPRILGPKKAVLKKLVVFVPEAHTETVANALFDAGAGGIGNYDECSFTVKGTGSFKAGQGSDPYVGEQGKRHLESENRLEVVLEDYRLNQVLEAMFEAHPYDEVAYDLLSLDNQLDTVGSGMVGTYSEPVYTMNLLQRIKNTFGGMIRHTDLIKDQVSKIAWCGGSGSFLLPQAKAAGAELFLTSDFKYHQFFESENEIIIVDIGHYENEQFTKDLLAQKLREKFPNFAVLLTETNTNPINYL